MGKLERPHCDLTGIIVNKGNHPQKALIQVSEILWLAFARYPRNSMRDCNLLCCFRACFSHTASMQNIDITCVSWHFCTYLTLCQNHFLKVSQGYPP